MLHHERRTDRRYLVEGKAVVKTDSGQFAGALVDVSAGGVLLVTGGGSVPVGTLIVVTFTIDGYPVEINVKGRVTRTATHVVGIAFSDPPVEVDLAITWLEAGLLLGLR